MASSTGGTLVFDLADPQELQGYVRQIQQELEENEFTLSQFLPNTEIDQIDFRLPSGTVTDEPAAPIRAWDTESPIAKRQGITRKTGELPPFSKKIPLGEEQRLRLRALERGNNQQIVDAIFNDAARMARAVLARIEQLRGEALYTGQMVFNENGVQETVNFERDASMSVAPGTLWSNHATADPISDLLTWIQAYDDLNGETPGVIVTSRLVLSDLLLNEKIRTYTATVAGTPEQVSRATLNNALANYDLPPIMVYETKVRNVAGTQVRVIPNDRLLLLPRGGSDLGTTLFGPTAEALELVEARQIAAGQAPGLVSVVEKTTDPVSTWTKAVAVALPILANPNLAMVADVR